MLLFQFQLELGQKKSISGCCIMNASWAENCRPKVQRWTKPGVIISQDLTGHAAPPSICPVCWHFNSFMPEEGEKSCSLFHKCWCLVFRGLMISPTERISLTLLPWKIVKSELWSVRRGFCGAVFRVKCTWTGSSLYWQLSF